MMDTKQKKLYEIVIPIVVIVLAVISIFSVSNKNVGTAVDEIDSSLQDQYSDMSNEDLLSEAVLSGNQNLCVDIEDSVLRSRCERLTAPPPVLSETEESDNNLLSDAILSGDGSLCSQIVDSTKKSRCERLTQPSKTNTEVTVENSVEEQQSNPDSELLSQAVLTGDGSLCAQIIDVTLKDRCLRLTG